MTVRIENLSFAFGRTPVFHEVNFTLEAGEIACLVGPNGAGKSTLIKCVGRLLSPQSGAVRIDGKDIAEIKPGEYARTTGYVPQSVEGAFPHTVFDEVLIGRRPYLGWRVQKEDIELVSRTLVFLGLGYLAERFFDELSGGERQKVTIARALAQEPKILLLDEPTSNLDIRHQLEVMDMLRNLSRERGILVLMALHDLNLAARYSDTILMIGNRTVRAAGTPGKVLTPERIEEIYGVYASVVEGPHATPHVIPLEVSGDHRKG